MVFVLEYNSTTHYYYLNLYGTWSTSSLCTRYSYRITSARSDSLVIVLVNVIFMLSLGELTELIKFTVTRMVSVAMNTLILGLRLV